MPIHSDNPLIRARAASARLWASCALGLVLLVPLSGARAAEIHSNGQGGGRWSEPTTWHGSEVPGPEDTVVIAMRDRVTFDRDDSKRISCRALHLDPESVLTFATGTQRLTLTVAGRIDAYGTIRIDGTSSDIGVREIRLVGEPADRRIRLREHAALLLYGSESRAAEMPNVRLVAGEPDTDETPEPAHLVADGKVMVDLHHSRIDQINIDLANLDNSGGSRERLNLIGNHFTGQSTLRLEACDTPVVRHNHFQADANRPPTTAIMAVESKLIQIQHNIIEGPYATAIRLDTDTNSTIAETRIIGVTERGVDLRHAIDTSLQRLRIDGDGAAEGVQVYRSDEGVLLEQVHVANAQRGYRFDRSRAQLTDCSARDLEVSEESGAGVAVDLSRAAVQLVNTPFEPDQIAIDPSGNPPNGAPYVQTMQYVIVRVTAGQWAPDARDGEAAVSHRDTGAEQTAELPAGLRVRLQTSEASGGVPENGADLNVRNSPVPVSRTGLTPMPRSQHALTVRSWHIDRTGEFRQAPFYDLIVEARAQDTSNSRKTLLTRRVEPRADWFRPEPNAPEPTIELSLP